MIHHSTTQNSATHSNQHSSEDAVRYLRSRGALLSNHWVCSGCGTPHEKSLPEECKSCGATALEFVYAIPAETEARFMQH